MSIDIFDIGGSSAGKVKYIAIFTVQPCSQNDPVITVTALVMKKLTNYISKPLVLDKAAAFLKSLPLADIV